ncbi:MAG TPA: rhombosortase [Gemmatimonadaceae bacterium]|nr:rhombosortase [Gemmatimonadaceae bacterium]
MIWRRLPLATIALAASAIAVALIPALQRALVLDRDAVAAGELWRIATGSLVHFSTSHLLYDLAVVIVASALLERRGWPVAPIVLASATAIGAAVLLFTPEIARYGGLSGVASSLVALYAVDCLTVRGAARAAAVLVLVLTAIKLGWELSSGTFVFVGDAGDAFRPVPLAHIVGAGVGIAAFFLSRAHRVPNGAPTLVVSERAPA